MTPDSVKSELTQHVQDLIDEGVINADNIEEAHDIAFNQTHYVVGYYNAAKWLETHGINAFDAVAYVVAGHRDHYGEVYLTTDPINEETIANQYVYFAAYDIDFESMLAAPESE